MPKNPQFWGHPSTGGRLFIRTEQVYLLSMVTIYHPRCSEVPSRGDSGFPEKKEPGSLDRSPGSSDAMETSLSASGNIARFYRVSKAFGAAQQTIVVPPSHSRKRRETVKNARVFAGRPILSDVVCPAGLYGAKRLGRLHRRPTLQFPPARSPRGVRVKPQCGTPHGQTIGCLFCTPSVCYPAGSTAPGGVGWPPS